MPWKECSVMDERLRFVSRLLDGEAMAEACREFGIARKTGDKIFNRYKEHGLGAPSDRSRRPVRYANQLPQQIESPIVGLKRDKPHWWARKIRELLVRRLDGDMRVPAKSTIHAFLHRHGLVKPPGRPRRWATGTALSTGAAPNDLWCADFKGEFKLGNGRYCYPLTVTDHAARFLLLCEALESTRENLAVTACAQLFAERGLPLAIRSDNGVPFAGPNALFNRSKLSVWWLRLGIAIERIKPGQPQQNGRHERMHLTLKQEARARSTGADRSPRTPAEFATGSSSSASRPGGFCAAGTSPSGAPRAGSDRQHRVHLLGVDLELGRDHLVAQRDAHLCERVLRLAGALRRLGGPAGEALQRHVEGLLLDARRLGGKPQLLQRLDADADLVGRLADRIRRGDRAVDQGSKATDRGDPDQRATERADAGAQQFCLATQALQPARGTIACALDALQALLAALAHRDQLGLDLAAALDRQADGVGVRASGHLSGASVCGSNVIEACD
jgi:transposase InsO family protein